MEARLVQVLRGELIASTELGVEPLVIGRDATADLVLVLPGVSRHHVVVELLDQGHVVRDLGSTNGTRVNGEYLSGPTLLRAGDVLRLGDEVTLVYELAEKSEPGLVVERDDLPTSLPPEIVDALEHAPRSLAWIGWGLAGLAVGSLLTLWWAVCYR